MPHSVKETLHGSETDNMKPKVTESDTASNDKVGGQLLR